MADRRREQRDVQPTDLYAKLTALQRRNAGPLRPRDRPPPAAPQPPPPRPARTRRIDADHDDGARRLTPDALSRSLKISAPDSLPDTSSRPPPRDRPDRDQDTPHRQLFDPRKDDPVRFAVLARPSRKSSGDYVSASSTSSYANSAASSAFTLSSTTDGSSASSDLFDRPSARGDDPGTNRFAVQLKKLYRAITALESKINSDDPDPEQPRVTLKGKQPDSPPADDLEREKWKLQIDNHKQHVLSFPSHPSLILFSLAEYIHSLLEISLSPSVPASLRNIPTRYNIVVRLWTYAFYKLLESLRRASISSPLALEHLQDFIYYAYTFYTGLLEEPILSTFKSGWIEALGDLARYRMAVAAMVAGPASPIVPGRKLTLKEVHDAASSDAPKVISKGSTSGKAAARIDDDSPSPSVGIAAARQLLVEPDTERWRNVARDWYGIGLADQPGTGKLHHHLGLLCRDVQKEELKGVYHFVKSMTTLHPFSTSRESVLPIWSVANQTRRAHPDTPAPDLFVLLHGMLFTHIQLDDFAPTLARFIERLSMEDLDERVWIMMAIINIGAIFEYGRPGSLLGRMGGKESVAVMTKPEDENMDVDASPRIRGAPEDAAPPAFKYALQLAFSMLSYVLQHPVRTKPNGFTRPNPNPYLPVMLTFLATVLKSSQALGMLERAVPWEELARFFARIPRTVMTKQGLFSADKEPGSRWALLTSGMAPPLPEDWCIRGMEWVGRSVFERGYWKGGEERRAEIEVLEEQEWAREMTDGRIEDDDGEEEDEKSAVHKAGDVVSRRWTRIVRSAVGVAGLVDGFTWVEGTREWRVEGRLAEKVHQWREQDRIEREEEEKRRLGTRWNDDLMDIDDESSGDVLSEEDDDDENDTPEVKELKARRRYLQSLLQSAQRGAGPSSPPRRRPRPSARTPADTRPPLHIVPGHTVLVVDTNILLSSLPMFAAVVESLRWTVVVPLPVIMELDGLSANASAQLSEAAQGAVAYVSTHIRSHAVSLKVQTSKGNYLTTLSVRTEQVDFAGDWERSTDDLILRAAIWQEEHWVERAGMLGGSGSGSRSGEGAEALDGFRHSRVNANDRTNRPVPPPLTRSTTAVLDPGDNPSFQITAANKSYKHQYANIYFTRLRLLRRSVEERARRRWGGHPKGPASPGKPLLVPRVLEVVKSRVCYIVGTVYMDMPLKPNVIEDLARDQSMPALPPSRKFYSPDDNVMLEDESGRIRLVGELLKSARLVTGVIVGALGAETPEGDFEVVDLCYPGMAPQESAEDVRMDVDADSVDSDEWIAVVSGLGVGSPNAPDAQIQMLVEYLAGEEGGVVEQGSAARISRLVVAGNSLAQLVPAGQSESGDIQVSSKKSKRYGYDATSFSPHPVLSLSDYLHDIASALPVHILPGESDPSGTILPQRAFPKAMFGAVAKLPTFSCETNPTYLRLGCQSEEASNRAPIERNLLINSGQPLDDMFKYLPSPPNTRLSVLESTLKWRHMAPTAPDTLWCHPYFGVDPFIITETPDLYIVGNQKRFATKIVVDQGQNDEGSKARCRIVLVPEFSKTGVLVLINLRSLDVKTVTFAVHGMTGAGGGEDMKHLAEPVATPSPPPLEPASTAPKSSLSSEYL
ncbi:hypothetical protein C0993_005683 [Termitomyces sp. T159_Od127]|nr:hypothetical protein C0993_005683 [Termitomyces sp. T159_Od127]